MAFINLKNILGKNINLLHKIMLSKNKNYKAELVAYKEKV
jgi:hypothetical protein